MKGRVLEVTNIVDLIGRTVALKRAGKDFLGLCPFHQEKTPSFHVNPAGQFFYCFGCKKGGNVIDFVIERDRIEFKDALRQLAVAAGLPIADDSQRSSNRGEMQALRDANAAACLFFEKQLADSKGAPARDYLASRGFTLDSIKRFHIGLAVDSWDAFLSSPSAKKFQPGQLALAGLVKPRENGEGFYDTFRNRLMFPIRDAEGRVIAFGGRVMPGSDDKAKYLNSPQTPLFDKGSCAFGLDLAKVKITETRLAAIVEGYTDVVMAHQFGCSNVVSILGTALTARHVSLLGKYADKVVLLFDPDVAGEIAVDRAVEIFLTQDRVEISVASLPDGLDPDEFLLQRGAEAFNAILAGATDALTYKWKQLSQRFKDRSSDLTGQQKAVDEYIASLAGARQSGHVDPIRWGAALNRVSRLTGIPADLLHRRLLGRGVRQNARIARPGGTSSQAAEPPKPKIKTPSAQDQAEATILGYLLCEPSKWVHVQKHIAPADFGDELRRQLAEIYWQHQQDEGETVFNQFLTLLDAQPQLKEIAVELAQNVQIHADADIILGPCIEYIRLQRLRCERDKREALLRQAQNGPGQAQSGTDQPSAVLDEAAVLAEISEFSRIPDPRRLSV
ncbi:MAG: DNA primase [Tepidisphaeraceae bacterium]